MTGTRCATAPPGAGAGVTDLDRRLESAITDLLARRARSSSICPSGAARAVVDEDRWAATDPGAP